MSDEELEGMTLAEIAAYKTKLAGEQALLGDEIQRAEDVMQRKIAKERLERELAHLSPGLRDAIIQGSIALADGGAEGSV